MNDSKIKNVQRLSRRGVGLEQGESPNPKCHTPKQVAL